MQATYDETVELDDGRTGVVVAIGAQLTHPFARRYYVRLNGIVYADAPEVEIAEAAIVRVVEGLCLGCMHPRHTAFDCEHGDEGDETQDCPCDFGGEADGGARLVSRG